MNPWGVKRVDTAQCQDITPQARCAHVLHINVPQSSEQEHALQIVECLRLGSTSPYFWASSKRMTTCKPNSLVRSWLLLVYQLYCAVGKGKSGVFFHLAVGLCSMLLYLSRKLWLKLFLEQMPAFARDVGGGMVGPFLPRNSLAVTSRVKDFWGKREKSVCVSLLSERRKGGGGGGGYAYAEVNPRVQHYESGKVAKGITESDGRLFGIGYQGPQNERWHHNTSPYVFQSFSRDEIVRVSVQHMKGRCALYQQVFRLFTSTGTIETQASISCPRSLTKDTRTVRDETQGPLQTEHEGKTAKQ